MNRPLFFGLFAISLGTLATTVPAQDQPPATQGRGRGSPRLVVPGRSVVSSKFGIVSASSPIASSAGVQVLERGGNAIDAAIAANAAVGLAEPMSNGIGGDLFAIIYIAKENKVYGINSSGWAATGMTREMLASKGVTRMPGKGVWTVTVPGAVAGWQAMRDKFGALPLATDLAPAIYYAKNGFPVTQVVAGEWRSAPSTPNGRATYFIGDHTPREGEVFTNPLLAASLQRIATQGRDGFYKGPTADAILAELHAAGGTMTSADLTEFQPEWVDPISTTYHGWTVYEMPPQSQGIGALMMLNIMEQFPVKEWGYKTTKSMHMMIEAKKLAYQDVLRYVADPRMAKVPVAQMLSKTRAAERAKLIDMTKANCDMPADSIPSVTDGKGNDTIYLTTIDKDGNIVSLIQSNYDGFGSGLVPKDVGFVLHNRGGLFTLEANHPNTIAPRKRPLHTIIPAFMEKDNLHIGFGIMGGWNQAQAHAQFVSNIADFGLNIQEALEAGRFTQSNFTGCNLNIESLIPDSVRTALTALGHRITVPAPRSGTFGYGQVVMLDATSGVHFGASEPRHDGMSIPEQAPVFAAPARAGGAGRGQVPPR